MAVYEKELIEVLQALDESQFLLSTKPQNTSKRKM